MTKLSVLDLSPVSLGGDQAQAVRDTIEVAKAADRLGYHRFWMAEHHSMESIASASPEVLIAAISQVTQRIRLGSGGVMLPNYSPLKVAEVFMALEALAPGRIDLGLGRALGADGLTGRALGSAMSDVFPQYFALLNAWLLDSAGVAPFPASHPYSRIKASPKGPSHPQVFLLCSSPDSARFAGQAGIGMVFAEFIARADGEPAVAAYREAFEPSVMRATPWAGVATIAFAAETAEDAARLDAPRRAGNLAFLQGREAKFSTVEAAVADLQARRDDPMLAAIVARSIVGEAADVHRRLLEKGAATGADEVFFMTSGPTLADRVRSLELIAEEASLRSRTPDGSFFGRT